MDGFLIIVQVDVITFTCRQLYGIQNSTDTQYKAN